MGKLTNNTVQHG